MRGGGEPAAEELRALLHEVGLLLLRGAALADELIEAGYAHEHGYESTVEWIRHECRVAFGVAADLVCVGSQMGVLADSVRAVERGEIGYGHLVHMARTQREVGEERGIDEAARLGDQYRCRGSVLEDRLVARHSDLPAAQTVQQLGHVNLPAGQPDRYGDSVAVRQ